MPRYGGRPTVEGCQSLVLAIAGLMRPIAAARRKGAAGPLALTRRLRWAAPAAEVEVAITAWQDHGVAVLEFDVEHAGRPTGPQTQRVALVTRPCHFGGVRWLWGLCCKDRGERA